MSWPATGLAGARIGVGSLATGESKVLDLPGTTPLGVADGQLFYVSTRGVLTAVPFDLQSLTPNGAPRALVGTRSMSPPSVRREWRWRIRERSSISPAGRRPSS